MEISIQRCISDRGALKIKEAAEHLEFFVGYSLMSDATISNINPLTHTYYPRATFILRSTACLLWAA